MAAVLTEVSDGSVTPASLGTYDDLANTTDAGTYYVVVDLDNLLDNERFTIRIRLKARSSSSLKVIVEEDYTDAQAENLIHYGPIASAHEIDIDIKQTGGTLRAYEYSLMREVDADEIEDLVWDAAKSDHTTADTYGDYLDDEITSRAAPGDAMDLITDAVDADAMAASALLEIEDQVWDALKADHTVADSFGDYLDVEVSSRAAPGDAMDLVANAVDAAAIAVGAIEADAFATDAITADALASDAVDEIVDQNWDETLDDHLSLGSTGEALDLASTGGGGGGGATAADVWEFNVRSINGQNKAGSVVVQATDLAYKLRRLSNAILVQVGRPELQE